MHAAADEAHRRTTSSAQHRAAALVTSGDAGDNFADSETPARGSPHHGFFSVLSSGLSGALTRFAATVAPRALDEEEEGRLAQPRAVAAAAAPASAAAASAPASPREPPALRTRRRGALQRLGMSVRRLVAADSARAAAAAAAATAVAAAGSAVAPALPFVSAASPAAPGGAGSLRRRAFQLVVLLALLAAAGASLAFEVPAMLQFLALHAVFGVPPADPCAPCGCGGAAYAAACAEPLAPAVVWSPAVAARAARAPALAAQLNVSACTAAADALAAAAGALGEGEGEEEEAGAPPRLLFHLYARPDLMRDGDLPAWQLTTLASIVASQRAGGYEVVVWSPDGGAPFPRSLAPLMRAARGAVRYRVYDGAREAAGSPLARSALLRFRDGRGWADSDVFRLVVLHRYGGVYLDLDVWLFRDLAPLRRWEWATEFAADGAAGGGLITLNNAALHFFARSPAIARLAAAAHAAAPLLRSWVYGPLLLDRARAQAAAARAPAPFALLPWCFFHGMWSVGDEASPLREIADRHVVGGEHWAGSRIMAAAYGLHLHGLPGKRAAAQGSIVDVLGRQIRAQAAARLGTDEQWRPRGEGAEK